MEKKKPQGLTGEALKTALWETLQSVKNRDIEPGIANSVATQSREILRVVKTEMEILKRQGKKLPASVLAAPKGRAQT